ncbi:MAG: hypothetical protein E6Q88_02100 [Lysobacteraceae bacterium]|nr:MAG: hypothetical protein E6Q88_02100 [Xanthomonadaceae bacterium]
MQFKHVVIALCVAVACVVYAPTARAQETWAEYSMMGQRRAAQIWSGGAAVSQFAWAPQSATESHVYWGDPQAWPPTYHERFIVSGDWVLLDGWWGNGTYYTLRVTNERYCDISCNQCATIATSGPQHYVRRQIPTAAYCLKADGVITELSSGKRLRFGHTQVYWPPASCSNAYISGQRCIRQWESWWDDNGTSYQRKIDRDQYLAKGLGNGFIIQTYYPAPWRADMRYFWNY